MTENLPQDEGIFHIDLTTIDLEMKSNWWHRICTKNFGFMDKIQLLKHCKVMNYDVLIHKELKEGEKFPLIHYFYILDKEAIKMTNDDIKKHMATKLIEYIQKYQRFPFACVLTKGFKNGNVQIDYTPNKWVNFALKVTPKKMEKMNIQVEDVYEYFKQFEGKETIDNPLALTKAIPTIR